MTPTLLKEMVVRVRRGRSFVWLSAYVIALALACVPAYAAAQQGDTARVGTGWMFGREVFATVLYVQAVLSAIAAPGLLCGAVSSETDQGTLPLLVASPAGPWEVLFGKLVPGLCFLALLTLTSLPLAGTCMVFGGVEVSDLVGAYAGLTAGMAFYGTLGLWASTLFLRTTPAAVFSYAVMFAVAVLGWVEPMLQNAPVYLVTRGLLAFSLALWVVASLVRSEIARIITGMSHLGCGCLVVTGVIGAVFCLGIPWTQGRLLVFLNPFSSSLPFSGSLDWPGLPSGVNRDDAIRSSILQVVLAVGLYFASYLRMRRLMIRGARSDPRNPPPLELPR